MTVAAAQAALDSAACEFGVRLDVDGGALLRERAEILGIAPLGTTSAGGTCRLLRALDGWVAINLARPADVDLIAAWMEHEWDGPPWDAVSDALTRMSAAHAVGRAQLLGIPAAAAVAPIPMAQATPTVTRGARRPAGFDAPLVLDLSALWAGPLCARLLGGMGARVVKVELGGRPDGARAGPPEFWERLNGAKEHVTLDAAALDPAVLAPYLDGASVVVTSARPRALDALGLGIDLVRRVHEQGLVWVAISGYGIASEWRDRVAFGDDAAVAGGLAVVAGGRDAPVFVGDAPADPLAGLSAAARASDLIEAGLGGVVDVSMRDVVAMTLGDREHRGGQPTSERYAATTLEVA